MVSNTPMHRTALLLLVVSVQSGELRLGQWALPTTAHIRSTIGSNSEARGVIREALELFFIIPKTPTDTLRSVNVLAEQLPTDWLPQVHGVTFVRIDLKDAQRKWQEECLRLSGLRSNPEARPSSSPSAMATDAKTRHWAFEFSQTYRGWERSSASHQSAASHIAVVSSYPGRGVARSQSCDVPLPRCWDHAVAGDSQRADGPRRFQSPFLGGSHATSWSVPVLLALAALAGYAAGARPVQAQTEPLPFSTGDTVTFLSRGHLEVSN